MTKINIEDFVSETLKQVVNGVRKAQNDTDDATADIAPGYGKHEYDREIKFKINVVADETQQGKLGWGIFVGGFAIGGEGQRTEAEKLQQSIEFSVPVYYKSKAEREP